MSIIVSPWVGRTGNVIYFTFQDNLGNPAAITAVNAVPVVAKNGSALSPALLLAKATWCDTSHDAGICGMVAWKLAAKALTSDVFTYSAAANWVTVNGGAAAAVTAGTSIANYTSASNAVEPTMPSSTTIKAGMNLSRAEMGEVGGAYWTQLNLKNLLQAGTNGVLTWTKDGKPLTISGSVTQSMFNRNNPNGVDGKNMPEPVGDYTYIADERNRVQPMTLTATTTEGAVSITQTAGTISGAAELGKKWVLHVVRGVPTHWNLNVTFTWTAGDGSTWTHDNMKLFRPGESIADYVNDDSPSPTLMNKLKASNGNVPYLLRWMEEFTGFGGVDSVSLPGESVRANSFSWSTWGPGNGVMFPGDTTVARNIPIQSIRPWNLATNPNIYLQSNFGGLTAHVVTAPGGSPGPYMVTPPNLNAIIGNVNPASSAIFEVVTTVPHGLKTLQTPVLDGVNMNGLVFNSGGANFTLNLQYNAQPIWVTSPTSFGTIASAGTNNTSSIGIPASVQSPTGCIVFVGTPTSGCVSIEHAAQFTKALGSRLWVNIPMCAGDDYITDIANRLLPVTTPGAPIWLEFANEWWNMDFKTNIYARTMANFTGNLSDSPYVWTCRASKNIRDQFVSIFGAAGRAADIKIGIGSWLGGTDTNQIIAAVNGNTPPIPIDAIFLANYPRVCNSASFITAASSTAEGGDNWSIADLLDLFRHELWFSQSFRGPNSDDAYQAGVVAGYTAGGPIPKVIAYEGSPEVVIPIIGGAGPNSGSGISQIDQNRAHDAQAHPNIYDLTVTFLKVHEQLYDSWCWFAFCGPRQYGVFEWLSMLTDCQKAGRGNGTGGGVTNRYATAQGGTPGDALSHEGPDGVNANGNDSVQLQALLDQFAATSGAPLTGTPTPTPTASPIAAGGTVMTVLIAGSPRMVTT